MTKGQTHEYYERMGHEAAVRSSITAVESKHTGKGDILILSGNIDEKKSLAIPDLFAFDNDWDNWLSPYRDLSDDKPISLF